MHIEDNPFSKLMHDKPLFRQKCHELANHDSHDSCLCSGVKSTSSFFPHNAMNNAHFGPGCIDKAITADKDNCLLAIMCQNVFKDEIPMPICSGEKGCMYPLWVGEGSGFESLQKETKCAHWGCVFNAREMPPRWTDGSNITSFIHSWKTYTENIK
jgi:hypothetical protein